MKKSNLKDGFTLVEVVILFIIFLTVAVLVVPLSVDDAVTAKNKAKWQHVQSGFSTIPISMLNSDNYKKNKKIAIEDFIASIIKIHPLQNVVNYKIKYLNGDSPEEMYTFPEIYNTDSGATIAFKWLNSSTFEEDDILGLIMYDVNGKRGPNVWGKDIFGFNVYSNRVEPFGKNQDTLTIDADTSRQGRGLYNSYAYLEKEQK